MTEQTNAQAAEETTSAVSLKELQEQKAALDAQIEAARKAEKKAAIAEIDRLMREFGIETYTVKAKPAHALAGAKIAPKYKDPVSGATWTGRGKKPVWFNPATAIKL